MMLIYWARPNRCVKGMMIIVSVDEHRLTGGGGGGSEVVVMSGRKFLCVRAM